MHTPSIHLIYAGGTFGSYGTPLSPLSSELLLPKLLQEVAHHGFDVTLLDNPVVKDSSTLTPADFVHFYQLICQAYTKGVRQFVLITGTDTLSFLAAFLSTAFANTNVSIVVTGSMLPLFNPTISPYTIDDTSDAWDNLQGALRFVRQHISGVYVSFYQQIFYGNSVQKIHSSDKNAFSGKVFDHANHKPHPHHPPTNITFCDVHCPIYTLYCVPNGADDLAETLLQLNHKQPSAVIILGFGAGNLPCSDILKEALRTLVDKHFLVIMASSCLFGARSDTYAAGAWQYDLGVLPSKDMSLPHIYAQALWLCLTLPAHKRQQTWHHFIHSFNS